MVWRRARTSWQRAGLEPIGLQEARHTFASVLIAAGVNAKAITTYMGHALVQKTYDLYGKLMPGSESEAAALVDAFSIGQTRRRDWLSLSAEKLAFMTQPARQPQQLFHDIELFPVTGNKPLR